MQDIGKIKCVVPTRFGQLTHGEDGFVYSTSNGKTYIVSYKLLDSLLTKRKIRDEQEQSKRE